ncbi:hypothetical protein QVD17_37822 [Tagetes erecta]|uniref:Uncharacterized protein n=1 Tax=Tagetes erecta TaxID=13708 RepID=A0AAD8JUR0_TARER|nr:hypothetical protein QVD17_37822 [Tagetes erecta]
MLEIRQSITPTSQACAAAVLQNPKSFSDIGNSFIKPKRGLVISNPSYTRNGFSTRTFNCLFKRLLEKVLELMLLKQFTELDIETNQHDYEEVYDKYECYFFSFTLCPLKEETHHRRSSHRLESRTLSGSGLEAFLTFQEAPHSISENFKLLPIYYIALIHKEVFYHFQENNRDFSLPAPSVVKITLLGT